MTLFKSFLHSYLWVHYIGYFLQWIVRIGHTVQLDYLIMVVFELHFQKLPILAPAVGAQVAYL